MKPIYMLRAIVTLNQSKIAHTQFLTIPARIVADSQYPFKDDEDLILEVHSSGLLIISKGYKMLEQPRCPKCESYEVEVGRPLYKGRSFDAENITEVEIPCVCACGHKFSTNGVLLSFINRALSVKDVQKLAP